MKVESIKDILVYAVFGAIILICTNGMTFTGLTVFDDALLTEFDWSKSTLKFRDFVNLACAALIMPFMGAIIDKYGVKSTLVFGLALLSLMFFCYSFIGAATHMYFIHVGFALAVSASGSLAVIIMVSQRVSENRGTAIGVALAGTSLGGIVIPYIAKYLLNNYDWRMAFRYEAILPLVVLIAVILILKKSDTLTESKSKKTNDLVEVEFKDAIKMKSFWFLAIIGFFCFYAILGIMGNLYLAMRGLDFSVDVAVNALGLISITILCAKFLSGLLTDYINKITLFRIQILILFLGTLALSFYTKNMIWIAIPIIGVGWGGLYTLINYIIITTFGVNSAGRIGGSISFFESLGAGFGIWLSGLIADQSGSYAMSFRVVAVFLFIAFVLSFFLKPVTHNES